MIPFAEGHAAALRALQTLWKPEQFIVIGAAAIARHMEFRWRKTVDLDLSVAVGLDSCVRDLERLGWRREKGAPQRWIVPDGALVDVLPGEPSLVRQGIFIWPDGSGQLSLVGFRLAFADAVPFELARGDAVRVASLRSLVVLKMAAYLDRPWERDSDLADIAHILSAYLPPDAEERWSNAVVEQGLDFEDVGPFVLGKQLATLVDAAERSLAQGFLTAIEDPADRFSTLHRMARCAPVAWQDPDRLLVRLIAFRRGFGSPSR